MLPHGYNEFREMLRLKILTAQPEIDYHHQPNRMFLRKADLSEKKNLYNL